MHYFSYGSNMSSKRLLERVPSAKKVGTGVLEKHVLRFHKVGKIDGTAKCDALETGDPDNTVYGVIYRICESEKSLLDQIEGLGNGYEEKRVCVRMECGNLLEAYTYYATHIDTALKPLGWYKEHVLRGAKEHGLPEAYIRAIESIEDDEDADKERHTKELAIYR